MRLPAQDIAGPRDLDAHAMIGVTAGILFIVLGYGLWIQTSHPPRSNPIGSTTWWVNLHEADQVSLQLLPGIGPMLAARIIQAMPADGFPDVESLDQVNGIGPKTIQRIKPYIKTPQQK